MATMKSSRKPKRHNARGGRAGRPAFGSPIQVRAARPCWTGHRPVVPTGLETARQPLAAAPIAREGVQGERLSGQSVNSRMGFREATQLRMIPPRSLDG